MLKSEDVLALIQQRDVRFIRLWFTDILGSLKSFAIAPDELNNALANGMGFDGSSITGYHAVHEADMVALPDPSTFQILPYRPTGESSVARMICDVRVPGGAPYEGDPRFILRRAIDRSEEMGFDHFYVGPELEYFYFRDSTGTDVLDRGGYFDLTTLDAASDLRRDTVMALEAMHIDIAYSHHESGPSQHEIDMRYGDALDVADNVMTYRTIVKEIAHAHGCYATFMPKPLTGHNGSGMHTHLSLFREGENAFYNPEDPTTLSADGRAFIAGILRHAREISCVFAQWVNSYKRLVPGFEAPVYVGWSRRNRSAIARVPGHHPERAEATRVELRCPDPACNPYLTFATILHAGLEGIERGYELPAEMEQNFYELTADERRRTGIETLPENLGEAIEAGAASELLLNCLGEHVHARYVELKRAEWEEYRGQVTTYELEHYLPRL
jgi:glutamine synthetase